MFCVIWTVPFVDKLQSKTHIPNPLKKVLIFVILDFKKSFLCSILAGTFHVLTTQVSQPCAPASHTRSRARKFWERAREISLAFSASIALLSVSECPWEKKKGRSQAFSFLKRESNWEKMAAYWMFAPKSCNSKNGAQLARFPIDLGQLLAEIDRVFPQVFDQWDIV